LTFRLIVTGGLGLLAQRRLPRVMARLNAGEDVNIRAEAPPLATSRDEIGQVRRAFNTVQRAAIEAAAEQARLRAGVSTVFRNLARRNQSLLHQQLSLLDAAEQHTTEPDELERLFRIDHLTTRMRRHAESLVVLAGEQPARVWTEPAPMVDVLRGAVAEVVDYARIRVACASRPAIKGHAAADVIHLIAELAENGTAFSPPDTAVRVFGSQVVQGFAVEIEDRGLGMTRETMAELNAALADPPPFNLADSERVVAGTRCPGYRGLEHVTLG
jgi:K+-sensing histidine kinase KdpD